MDVLLTWVVFALWTVVLPLATIGMWTSDVFFVRYLYRFGLNKRRYALGVAALLVFSFGLMVLVGTLYPVPNSRALAQGNDWNPVANEISR